MKNDVSAILVGLIGRRCCLLMEKWRPKNIIM